MPVFENAKVLGVKETWRSPDGQRIMYEVALDIEGQQVTAKSWSKAFSAGWTGAVETYEKDGKYGAETYVKQPQREGGYSGGGGFGGRSGGGKPMADPFTMYLSYAKDVAVAMIATGNEFKPEVYKELLSQVATGGKMLYNSRPEASSGTEQTALATTAEAPEKPDTVAPVPDEPFNLDDIPF